MRYLIPAQAVIDEQIIKKSRFITYIQHTANKEQAVSFVQETKEKHPDARHHCWAYIAGHPTATTAIAFSDDGEPQGTAGKPILNVLQHRHVGEITLVVVRYFGGIKLGAGGLVRAYSSSAHLAMENLETKSLIATKRLKIAFDYALESKVSHFLQEHQIKMLKSDYLERVFFQIEVEEQAVEQTELALVNITSGRISLIS
ncbi:MAG: YigZ family protein [Ghiorsea sp.]